MITTDLDQLSAVPVPRATDTYSPVPHTELVGHIDDKLGELGIDVARRNFRSNRSGTQLLGLIDLGFSAPSGFGYRLIFRNSYDKSMALSFNAGAVVLVCSNGMVVPAGEAHTFRRKHTGAIRGEIKGKVHQALRELTPVMKQTLSHAEAMQAIQVDPTAAAELCGRMFIQEEIINSTQLNIVKRELAAPSYDAFADTSLWSLYNHVTHALKQAHPTSYLEQHTKLHKFVETEFNL